MVDNKTQTYRDLLKSGMSPTEIRKQVISQRKGTAVRAAERKAAKQVRQQKFGTIQQAKQFFGKVPKNVLRRTKGFGAIQQRHQQNISQAQKLSEEIEQQQLQELQRLKERVKQAREQDDDDDEDDYEDEISERKAYYKEYKKGLQQGQKALAEGKLLSIDEIKKFARKRANIAERNERAENRAREARREARESFEESFKEKTGVSYDVFSKRYSPGVQADILTRAKMKETGLSKQQAQEKLIDEGTLKVEKIPAQKQEAIIEEQKIGSPGVTASQQLDVEKALRARIAGETESKDLFSQKTVVSDGLGIFPRISGRVVSGVDSTTLDDNIPSDFTSGFGEGFSQATKQTAKDFGMTEAADIDIRTQPFITKRIVDTTDEGIPITETVVVDPTGIGKQKERLATPKERKILREQETALRLGETASTEDISFGEKKRQFKEKIETGLGVDLDATTNLQNIISESREKTKELKPESFGGKVGRAGGALVLGGAASAAGTLRFGEQLLFTPVETSKGIVKGVGKIVQAPGIIVSEAKMLGRTAVEEPFFAAGFVGSEITQDILLGKGIIKSGKIARKAGTRISPKFRKFDDLADIKTSRGVIDLEAGGTVKQLETPLSKQVNLAGQKVDAVSAARDLFGTVRKRKIKIDKPLPTPDAPDLERAFFADPAGRIRPSRLGLGQKEAGLSDIFSGDITFKRVKPQAIVFPQTIVEKFPKRLQSIQKKLKAGKTLTPGEKADLLKFQLTPSGEFKPVGFLSKEPEITLAPGEIIKRKGVVGRTIVEGEAVPIIEADVVKATKETTELLAKQRAGRLSNVQQRQLTKNLARESGFPSSSFEVSTSARVSPATPISSGISSFPKPSEKTTSIRVNRNFEIPSQPSGIPSRTQRVVSSPGLSRTFEVSSAVASPPPSQPTISKKAISPAISSPPPSSPPIGRLEIIPGEKPKPKPRLRKKKVRKKKIKRKDEFLEPELLPQGFTAAQLGGRRKRITEAQARKLARSPGRAIGIRGAYEIVSNKPRRKTPKKRTSKKKKNLKGKKTRNNKYELTGLTFEIPN